jgi:Kef-type K+ transport system membrane component KefB
MESTVAMTLATLGALLLLGLLAEVIGQRSKIPRVTMLILLGMLMGEFGLDFISGGTNESLEYITTTALTMIGFLLGGKLNQDSLKEHGHTALVFSLLVTMGTFLIVFFGLKLIGLSSALAAVFACISLATDPIATLDVLNNSTSRSRLKFVIPGIVALDDVFGLLLFAVVMALLTLTNGHGSGIELVFDAGIELFGSILLGIALGYPMAKLSGRIKEGEPTFIEALGMVMVCGGISLLFDLSYLLAGISMGLTVSLFASHHKFYFHEIEHVEMPFLMLFLILLGASFKPGNWAVMSLIGLSYIGLRIAGRMIGAQFYYRTLLLNFRERTYLGLSLLPQAGVALAIAVNAQREFPEFGQQVVGITIGATIVFELVGPILTGWSLTNTDHD